jgi:hypothetical protein
MQRDCFDLAEHACDICGTDKGRMDCHEVWHYDDERKIQRLERLACVCYHCHRTKHIGLAEVRGYLPEAVSHLATINNWSEGKAFDYVAESFEVWAERSKYEWALDISILQKYLPFVKDTK